MTLFIRACRQCFCKPKAVASVILLYAGLQILKPSQFVKYLKVKSEQQEPVPEWIYSAKAMKTMNETTKRCEAEDLGCFTMLSTMKPEGMDRVSTIESCLSLCFHKDLSFAGLRDGNCYCGKSVDNFVANRYCDVACSKEKSKNCYAIGSIRIFRKRGGCYPGVLSSALPSNSVGCTLIPKNIIGNMSVWTMSGMTIQQCILKCESIGRIFSMPLLHHDVCICSDLLSMFNTAEEMHTAMHSCEDSTSEKSGGKKVEIYKTFVQECAPKRFLKRKEGPFTILTSFWGSGNTWLRHLLEVATGIYTGSIYKDEYLYNGGMIGENLHYLSGRTIIIKDHIMCKPAAVSKHYTSAVLILRNIYDATLAEFSRLHSHNNHTALLDPNLFTSKGFRKSASELVPKWLYHVQMLFNGIPRVLVVYYEDLQKNCVHEVRRILSFLPQNLMPHGEELEKRLMCMMLDSTGNFKRESKAIRQNPYDEDLQKLYNSFITKLNDFLLKKEQPELPASYFEQWNFDKIYSMH